jgi:uncharacterized protein
MKIAVIGSGISGLSAAFFLAQKHEVTLFEADGRVGGHTNTIPVTTPNGPAAVDTGWIVYNGINYPNLTALFKELDVATRPTSMSFAVSIGSGAYEWKGSDQVFSVFAQWTNLFKPRHIRMLLDILKLNKRCNALLKSGNVADRHARRIPRSRRLFGRPEARLPAADGRHDLELLAEGRGAVSG